MLCRLSSGARRFKTNSTRGWSREIEPNLAGEVTFPVLIDCVYQRGRYDGHGVTRHGYAADAPFIDTPRDAREHYSKRFGIESSYRLALSR